MKKWVDYLTKYIFSYLFSGGLCLALDKMFHVPDPFGPFLLGGFVCVSFLMYEDFLENQRRHAELFLKYVLLFHIGGAIYWFIEILYRGYSHWSMYILGGICFLACGLINEKYNWDMPMVEQMGIASILITVLEFIVGLIVNKLFMMNVWDYSNVPLNIMGQICLPFTVIWFFLSGVAIVLDDYLRHWFFKEEKPRYKLF